jgi:hypothetical protein
MQTCNDRDQKNRLIEEKSNKLAFIESEKHKLDEIVSENQINFQFIFT